MAQSISLFCIIYSVQDAAPFSIKVTEEDTVHDLKKLIKEECKPEMDNIASHNLKLWTWNQPGEVKDLDLNCNVLDPMEMVSSIFGGGPPQKHCIHIVVKFLGEIPPAISYEFRVSSSTVPAHGFTPCSVIRWIDFVGGAQQYVPGTRILLDCPVFMQQPGSNETEVTSVFTSNITYNLRTFYKRTTEEAVYFRQEVTLPNTGRPDYCVQRESKTILVMELKAKWNIDSTDIIYDYNNQVGTITNAIQTWFLYRPIEDPECLKISDCIVLEASNPTLLRCLAYIVSLALQNPDCPHPQTQTSNTIQVSPQPFDGEDSSGDDEDGGGDDDEAKDPTIQPSDGSSSEGTVTEGFSSCGRSNRSRGNQCSTTGKWVAKGRKLRFEQFGWDSFKVGNILGEGRSGAVYEAMFRGERVAVKLCDLWQHPKYHKEMLAEATTYMALDPLQGKCIPKLKGVGYTGGGLFALVMELGGSPIVVENLNDDMRERILTVLASIHGLGFLHGDIRSQNILIKYCDNGPNIMFIDFGFSRKISNQEESAGEMTALKNVLGFRSRLV